MAARGRRAGRSFRRSGGNTDWARLVSTVSTTLAANTKIIAATFQLSNPGIGETVRRTRGRFMVVSDQVSFVEDHLGAMGMMIVNDVAAGIGITAIPGPVTEAGDDGWFVWEPLVACSQMNPTATSSGIGSGSMAMCSFEFDSKAMRRVEEGFQMVMVVENASSSTGFKFAFGVSLLSSRTGS